MATRSQTTGNGDIAKVHPQMLRDAEVRAVMGRTQTTLHIPLRDQIGDPVDYTPDAERRVWIRASQSGKAKTIKSPIGGVGDLLWVRESFAIPGHTFMTSRLAEMDASDVSVVYRDSGHDNDQWHPPVSMPRWASRLTLRVRAIDILLVQDLTDEDAKRAGITASMASEYPDSEHPYLSAYRRHWSTIHRQAARRWESNPLIWCGSIDVIPGNVDEAN